MTKMQALIKEALDAKFADILKSIPTTKEALREIEIGDIRPVDIADFMRDNGIPSDAKFSVKEEEAWGFSTRADFVPSIYYYEQVPTDDKDRQAHIETRFKNGYFKPVFDILTANGYKRIGSISSAFKAFDDTTPYKMYMAGDFERLEKYYSLSFTPIEP